jgi:hypothetical protein
LGRGADVAFGDGGDDLIHGIDGVAGNDTLHGGLGRDGCEADGGDTVDRCELT